MDKELIAKEVDHRAYKQEAKGTLVSTNDGTFFIRDKHTVKDLESGGFHYILMLEPITLQEQTVRNAAVLKGKEWF